MIVTIDGPAGAGKSTVARTLARRLGFGFLDTGAMYRAVALAGLRRGVDWDRQEPLAELAGRMTLQFEDRKLLLDGEDVTEAIRDSEVTAVTRHAADNPQVRSRLVELQRRIAGRGNFVTEGRDQGTVVFPQAACKIFLTASAQQRASRRLADLQAQGETTTLDRVLADQQRRDREDCDRAVGALKPAEDAVEVNTDGMTLDQVVDHLESLVRKRA
ncbi:MAG: (d)CMP kinase [Planctomycetes bacterium]|nr:(d)CMP kinase [Planctomycetota bacterium]